MNKITKHINHKQSVVPNPSVVLPTRVEMPVSVSISIPPMILSFICDDAGWLSVSLLLLIGYLAEKICQPAYFIIDFFSFCTPLREPNGGESGSGVTVDILAYENL